MRLFIAPVIGSLVLCGLAASASAFTSEPANPVAMSNKLADPDDITEQMSNGDSPLGQQGSILRFSAPSSSPDSNGMLWGNPSTVFVPSEHR